MRTDGFTLFRQRPKGRGAGSGGPPGGALPADPTRALLADLLAWWRCGEAAGSSRADSTAAGNTLAETGGTVGQSAGLIGNAASFTGTSTHYLKLASRLIASGACSYSAWFNPTSVALASIPMGQGVATGIRFSVTSTTVTWGFSANSATYSTPLATATWSHLCGTYNGSTARLFVGGVLRATSTPTVSYAGTTFALGARSDAGASGYNGLLQLAGVWGRALSDGGVSVGQAAADGSDVALLYGGGLGFDPTA